MKNALRAVLGSVLLGAAPALADGSIVGTITDDETKAPAAGITVVASSPHLMGEKTVKTDAEGHYRLDQLPEGPYTIVLYKEGSLAGRKEVRVRLQRTFRVDMELYEFMCRSG